MGKTSCVAWVVLWGVLVFDDIKIPTTASVWRQLSKFLWPEIHKWAGLLDWEKIGREPFDANRELLGLSLRRLPTCEAFAVACRDPATIEGAHARVIVYIFDEAKTIPDMTWDAAEGAFSQAGTDTDALAFAIAISTPGVPQGRFYDIHRQALGLGEWWVRHITLEESIAAGQVSREWAETRKEQWGEQSAVYINRCLGEFASSEEDSIIPLAWIELANQRWREWDDSGRPAVDGQHVLGVDVARFGEDRSAVAERIGDTIINLEVWGKTDTMETAGKVKTKLRNKAYIDVIGIGAGVVDRLKEQGCDVIGVNFAGGTNRKDKSGEIEMLNIRAGAWWGMRERLEPNSGEEIKLPPDDELVGDLTAPRYSYTSSGKLKVESKEDIRKRLGRSPDVGDAVVLAFWGLGVGQSFDSFLEEKDAERERMQKELFGG